VSTSPDATGTYNRYAFAFDNFNDYPKLGVWPDGYYMSFNMFQSGFGGFIGPRACALDRKRMLAGQSATMQCFQLSSSQGTLLPSDQDGPSVPPVGSPNYFLRFGTIALRLSARHIRARLEQPLDGQHRDGSCGRHRRRLQRVKRFHLSQHTLHGARAG